MNIKKHLNTIIYCFTALVVVIIFSQTYKSRHRADDSIRVTGSGSKDFKSDLIVWKGTFNERSTDLQRANYKLQSDKNRVRNYLIAKGVDAKEIRFSSVNIPFTA